MKAETQLQSSQQWKAVSHPLRLGILRLLADEARTNEELAKALDVASGKLYFHTKKLLDAGLIEFVGTRQKGPLTEKLYRAVARRYTVAEPVPGGDHPPFEGVLASALELYRTTWYESEGLKGEVEGGFHFVLPQSPERVREFIERFHALARDFQDSDASLEQPGVRALSIAVLLHSIPMAGPKTEEE